MLSHFEKNKVINLDIDSDNESTEKNEEDDAMSQNTAEIVENASNGKCNYKNFIRKFLQDNGRVSIPAERPY